MPSISYAQFYDDEDELYFYDYDGDESANCAFVFNFDGYKGTRLNRVGTRLEIVNNLKDDINYFEKKVFEIDYNLKYVGKTSNGMTEYLQKETYVLPWGIDYSIIHFYFSSDRRKLVYKCDGDQRAFHKVEKNSFLPGRSRRSLSENDVIYD